MTPLDTNIRWLWGNKETLCIQQFQSQLGPTKYL